MQMTCKTLANLVQKSANSNCKTDANGVQTLLDELESNGVFSRLENGTIISRRMYYKAQEEREAAEKEKEISDKRRAAAYKRHAKGGAKKHAKSASPSSSPTPSPKILVPKGTCASEASARQIAERFEDIWKRYPEKKGKKAAWKHFKAKTTETGVRTENKWTQINQALENYLQTDKVKNGFIMNGSTWFNNWTDYIDYEEPGTGGKPKRKPPYYYQRGYDFGAPKLIPERQS